MKNKTNPLLVIVLFAIAGAALVALLITLGAGSLLVITSSSGRQPLPMEASGSTESGYQAVSGENLARIDDFVTEQMQRHGLPGLALALGTSKVGKLASDPSHVAVCMGNRLCSCVPDWYPPVHRRRS